MRRLALALRQAASLGRSRPRIGVLLLPAALALIAATVLVGLNLNGSSVALLGLHPRQDASLVLGVPRTIRSDEWTLTTPNLIGNDRRHLPVQPWIGLTPTYLPAAPVGVASAHWTEVFKPTDWGFFLLSPARALAWRWWGMLVLGFLGCYALLLRMTRSVWVAAGLSTAIVVSPAVVWWSLMPAALVGDLAAATASLMAAATARRPVATLGWGLLGGYFFVAGVLTMYPPWLVSVGLVCAATGVGWVLDVRPAWRRVALALTGALAVAAPTLITWFHQGHAAILAQEQTAYPGQRSSPPGEASLAWLLDAPASLWLAVAHPARLITGHATNGTALVANQSEASATWLPLPVLAAVIVAAGSLLVRRHLGAAIRVQAATAATDVAATAASDIAATRADTSTAITAATNDGTTTTARADASAAATADGTTTATAATNDGPSTATTTTARADASAAATNDGTSTDGTTHPTADAPAAPAGSPRMAVRPAPERIRLPWTVLALGACLLLLLSWGLLPLPSWTGRFTGLSMVPGRRIPLALGLITVLLLAASAGLLAGRHRPTWLTGTFVAGGLITVAAVWWAVRSVFARDSQPPQVLVLAMAAALALGAVLVALGRLERTGAAILAALALIAGLPVNPLYHGLGPLDRDPLVKTLAAQVRTGNVPRVAVYGQDSRILEALTAASGAVVLSGLTVYPDRAVWQQLAPADEQIWNSYGKYAWTVDPTAHPVRLHRVQGTQLQLDVNPCAPQVRALGIQLSVSSTPITAACLVLDRTVMRETQPVFVYRYR